MPVIKSAKKKLRIDRKREFANKKAKVSIDIVVKKAQKNPTEENIRKAFKAVDKGVKKDIFHKNKGSRIKSSLSRLIARKPQSPLKSEAQKPANAKRKKKI